MDVTKGFGDIHGPKPYEFKRSRATSPDNVGAPAQHARDSPAAWPPAGDVQEIGPQHHETSL
jgi:hypothetical protein